MQNSIPQIARIRSALAAMTQKEVKELAEASNVPFGTVMKIRHGITENPGIETVRKFYPLLPGSGEGSGE